MTSRAAPTPPAAIAASFSTPALMVDLGVFEANVAAMEELLRGSGKTVRPHVKTHRTPELARRQLGGAAVGVTCATVGEAEVMVSAGIDDVLVANEVVDRAKIGRLVALAARSRIAVAVDAAEAADTLADAASNVGATVDVLIDVDTGLHRCGVATPDEAVHLARAIAEHQSLRLRGLMGYEGRIRLGVENRAALIASAYNALAETKHALVEAGFPVDVVSASGTSTLTEALADPTITELQSGVYALMEPELRNLGLPFQCAVAIRGTVISRHPDRVVLDVGRRVVGMEYGPPVPIGFKATEVVVSDEHTIISGSGPYPELGGHLDLIPGQIRTTFNLHDTVWAVRDGAVVDRWPVSARGSSQ